MKNAAAGQSYFEEIKQLYYRVSFYPRLRGTGPSVDYPVHVSKLAKSPQDFALKVDYDVMDRVIVSLDDCFKAVLISLSNLTCYCI